MKPGQWYLEDFNDDIIRLKDQRYDVYNDYVGNSRYENLSDLD